MSSSSISKIYDQPTILIKNETSSNNIKHEHADEETHYLYVYRLINSCALPMVMKASIDLGVLQMIHDHAGPNGLTPAEISTRVNSSNPDAQAMLDRMLQLLATFSIVKCVAIPSMNDGVERRYSASPATKYLVPTDDGVSLASLLDVFVNNAVLGSWSKLKDAVLEGGIPFEKANGMQIFEYASMDSKFNDVYNESTYDRTTFVIKKILDKYKGLENIKQIVDVGGNVGHTLRVITSKYPTIKGINFDLPHVIENAIPIPGVEHVSGDMFDSVPCGEVIFMKWILHDWSDEHCIKVLKNCYKALPKNGKVIIVEAIYVDEPQITILNKCTSLMDAQVMAIYSGGKERTRQGFQTLANIAGFADVKFVCCAYGYWVIEFFK